MRGDPETAGLEQGGRAGEARGEAAESCDWCGSAAPHETAVTHADGDPESDAAPLCVPCALGGE